MRRNRIWIALGIAAGVLITAIGVFAVVATGSTHAAPPAPVPPAVVEVEPSETLWPGERAAIDSCDPSRIRDLLRGLNEVDEHAIAIRAGTAYQKQCKRSSLFDHSILYAHEELEQWELAHPIADRLLREDPSDLDFWWWRGKVRRYLGQHAAAVVDFRQSLVEADADSNGIQIDHLDASAKALGSQCEAAFALRLLANAGVDLSSGAQRQFHEAYLDGNCARLDGRGSFTWSADAMKRAKLTGTIAGTKLVMMVDRGLGTPLVRRAIAEQLGLARGTRVDVMTPVGLGTGVTSTTTITLGTATAADVPVVIVDDLPAGVDVVIGLGFLWRFDVELGRSGYRATAPSHD